MLKWLCFVFGIFDQADTRHKEDNTYNRRYEQFAPLHTVLNEAHSGINEADYPQNG
ncbi:hypothetical protein [Chitinophaga sp.]|uniref:hypothetical protein n=1 Tax=Chitinophaga sp. TaxID=1869181 RepID=UPI002F94EA2A